jgi:hypothetical protein
MEEESPWMELEMPRAMFVVVSMMVGAKSGIRNAIASGRRGGSALVPPEDRSASPPNHHLLDSTMSSFLTRALRSPPSIPRSSVSSTRAIASSLVARANPQDAGCERSSSLVPLAPDRSYAETTVRLSFSDRENSKNADPQRSRQGDEAGIKV